MGGGAIGVRLRQIFWQDPHMSFPQTFSGNPDNKRNINVLDARSSRAWQTQGIFAEYLLPYCVVLAVTYDKGSCSGWLGDPCPSTYGVISVKACLIEFLVI